MPTKKAKPLILLTNDDGIEAPGIKDLHDGLKGLGRVWVVAPAVNQSASSHSFSLRKPIKVWRLRPRWLAVHGTPTDCVLISHHGILKREIDLVFSGINDSPNLGDDVLYSGTVAAAIEGAMLGMPAVAMSYLESGKNREAGSPKFLRRLVPAPARRPPAAQDPAQHQHPGRRSAAASSVTRLGRRIYRDMAIKGTLPDGERLVDHRRRDGVRGHRPAPTSRRSTPATSRSRRSTST